MTYQQITAMVEGIGLPCAYYQFPENTPQAPPFVCWFFTGSDDFAADNCNYQRIRPLAVELYTDHKDFALEATVEAAMNAAGLVYSREEERLDSERMTLVVYTASVVITEPITT